MEHVMSVVIQITNYIRTNSLRRRNFKSFLKGLHSDYGEIPLYTEVRWLSRGNTLDRFFHIRDAISLFLEMEGYSAPELRNADWLCDLGFFSDVPDHLNKLNRQLQGKDRAIYEYYNLIREFKLEIEIWKAELAEKDLSNFPKLESQVTQDTEFDRYQTALRNLGDEFTERYVDLDNIEKELNLIISPFTIDFETVSPQLQPDIKNLRLDPTMRERFDNKINI